MAEKIEPFYEVLKRLAAEFADQGKPYASGDELKGELYDLAKRALRELHSVKANTHAAETTDRKTIARIKNPEGLSSEFAVFEVFLRRLEINPSAALDYIEEEILRKQRAQRERGKRSGAARLSGMTELLRDIVAKNPSISADNAKRLLLKSDDVIVDGNQFTHIGDGSRLLAHNLPARLSKAKKWKNNFP